MIELRAARESNGWKWAGVLLAAIALALQFRFAFSYRPLSWTMLGDSDYQHLLPLELRAADSRLYRNDRLLLNVECDYPRVWVKATGLFARVFSGDLMRSNQVLGLATLAVLASGMFAFSLEATGSVFAAGAALLLLLGGGLDPHKSFFLKLSVFAIPREQAFSLYPWMLWSCLRRAHGKDVRPWEALLIAVSMNMHTPTTVYAVLGIASAWMFVPEVRPRWDGPALAVLASAACVASVSLVPFVRSFGMAQHAGKDFFLRFYAHYWPISNRPGILLKAAGTAYWWSVALIRLLALWGISRIWSFWNKDSGARAAAAAAASGTLLYAAYLASPAVAFNPMLFVAGYRAFLPAAIPLMPFAADLWRAWDGGRRVIVAAVGALLLVLSVCGNSSVPPAASSFAPSEEFLASAARAAVPQDAIIVIPTEWAEFRLLSRRACFGDHRVLSMVWAWDRSLGERTNQEWEALDSAYRTGDLAALVRVAKTENAEYAVVPSSWAVPAQDLIQAGGAYSLIRLAGDL